MADVKISALPAASTPLAGTEVLPIVQGGTTDQVTVANLTAGRTVNGAAFTATGTVSGATVSATGTVSGATVSATGTVSGATVSATGTVSGATVTVGDGTAALPSLTPTGDNNTGLWAPAADTLAFSTNGAERLRLNSSGQSEFVAGSASTPAITTTGDVNTGIYFPGADRIGFTEGGAQCGEFDASGNFLFNSGYGSAAIGYGCRAWVNFNGTGTVAIRASGNVSSITDNGTGDYTVNFTNAMPNANYASFYSGAGALNGFTVGAFDFNAARTVTACRFTTVDVNGNGGDPSVASVTIFR